MYTPSKKFLFACALSICATNAFSTSYIDVVRQRPGLSTAGLLGMCGLGYYWLKLRTPSDSHKQLSSFYANQHTNASLVQEPVEWPVKAFYANNPFGWLVSRGVDYIGRFVTEREKRLKLNPAYTQKYINHYLSFYKDLIDMNEYETPENGFVTFNDWFIRKLKNPEQTRPLEQNELAIASPADSKALVIPNLSKDTHVTIKEQRFNIAQFLNDAELAKKYEGGTMIIFRLAPYNYHRYHFPIDCTVSPERFIDGLYHSVNRRAFFCGVQPLTRNKRSYQVLKARDNRPDVVMVQVGATAVASIVNCFMDYPTGEQPVMKSGAQQQIFKKGDETGYFQFGGSTIVLVFPKNTITVNDVLVKNSLAGYETAVKVRETIGYWKIGKIDSHEKDMI